MKFFMKVQVFIVIIVFAVAGCNTSQQENNPQKEDTIALKENPIIKDTIIERIEPIKFSVVDIDTEINSIRIDKIETFLLKPGVDNYKDFNFDDNRKSGSYCISQNGMVIIKLIGYTDNSSFNLNEILTEELKKAIKTEQEKGKALVEILNINNTITDDGKIYRKCNYLEDITVNLNSSCKDPVFIFATLNFDDILDIEEILFDTTPNKVRLNLDWLNAEEAFTIKRANRARLLKYINKNKASSAKIYEEVLNKMQKEREAKTEPLDYSEETFVLLSHKGVVELLIEIGCINCDLESNSHEEKFICKILEILESDEYNIQFRDNNLIEKAVKKALHEINRLPG